jgi:hypothetical protein
MTEENKVLTIKGLIDISELEVRDEVEIFDNVRKTTTSYYHNGEFVRNDVWASCLRGIPTGSEQGEFA